MSRISKRVLGLLLLAVAVGAVAIQVAQAQQPPAGMSKMWPWNVQGYQGYNEPRFVPPGPPPTHSAYATPQKYTVVVSQLPRESGQGNANAVMLMAHLPEGAILWIENAATQLKGTLRTFESPPLRPGKEYVYTVRIDWVEDGKWVTQTRRFPVHAGDMQCIDIQHTDSAAAREQEKASLAKLNSEDRKLAEEQKFCALQNSNRLGSMGTPVKIMVKGQPVFLCCEGCVKKAESEADQTLAKVQTLKAKTSPK